MTKRSTWISIDRESGPLAVRQLKAEIMEGSFGTGSLNELATVGFHALSPLTDQSNKKGGTADFALYQCTDGRGCFYSPPFRGRGYRM